MMKIIFNIYINVLCIYIYFIEVLYFIFLIEFFYLFRCIIVIGFVRNVIFWFWIFVCIVIVRVIFINVKKDIFLIVNILFDLVDIYMYLVKKW